MSDVTADFFGGVTQPEETPPAATPTPVADPFDIFVPEQFTPAQAEQQPQQPPAAEETPAERAARLAQELATQQFQAAQQAQRDDAFARLRVLLSRIGLETLETNVRDVIARGITDPDAILFELRDTTQFRTRFAANQARANRGLPELDPGTYVQLEESYRETLRANGLPAGFYDEPDDFRRLIEGDVSPAELNQRVQQGYRLVADADPEVKRQMQTLYGVSEPQLAAYFIDPDRAAPILTRQAQAAQIAARAREQAGLQLGAETVEDLIARGYNPQEAAQTFQRVGELAGLYQEMAGEQMLTEEQKVGAAFGFDVQARQQLEERARRRVAEFQGGGQFAGTRGATSGTIETGLGTAQ